MSISKRVIRRGLAVTLLFGGLAFADDARELTWDDLIPDAEATEQPGDSSFDDPFAMPVLPMGVVEELDGVLVKIPGFVVPLEVSSEGKVSEFLLVPYFGACIHYPPPPANQIVYITAEEPMDLESTWEPIWATGELKTEFRESDLAYSGYTMAAQAIEVYEY
ncbi:MAG: DUF3299 domain-containing protein [Gammaproteobacteria bacterium]|nr:DUF3299 domain-containing protein [Gammaproteobacteria bacterium]MYL01100.1 DUF3299 domain-containing protein [Gammaproteobacteria bacterium]